MRRLNTFFFQVLPKMMRKNAFFFRVVPKMMRKNTFFFCFLPKIMRQRVPRLSRLLEQLDQKPLPHEHRHHEPQPQLPWEEHQPQAWPQERQPKQKLPRASQPMRKPKQVLRLQRLRKQRLQRQQRRPQMDLDGDDDDNRSSDSSSCRNHRHAERRLRLPFSFRTRVATPARAPLWGRRKIARCTVDYSFSSHSSIWDDDSVPTQFQVSDNEELWSDIEESSSSDDTSDELESDDATAYSIHIVVAKDNALELSTHQESSSMKSGPVAETMNDEGTIPDTSDLIANSCFTITIGRDLLGAYADTRDAFCQVLHAFTLGEGEINCVCGRLENAKIELSHLEWEPLLQGNVAPKQNTGTYPKVAHSS